MNILLAGANGQTGKILAERLVKSGYQVKGAIRKPEQVDGIRQIGAEPVMMDLTQPETFLQNLDGVDAVIFAAGSWCILAQLEPRRTNLTSRPKQLVWRRSRICLFDLPYEWWRA